MAGKQALVLSDNLTLEEEHGISVDVLAAKLWTGTVLGSVILGLLFYQKMELEIAGKHLAVIAAVALCYSVVRYWIITRRANDMRTYIFSLLGDLAIIGFGIFATGGNNSPYWLMLAVPILIITLRFGSKSGVAVALLSLGVVILILFYGKFGTALSGLNLMRLLITGYLFLLFSSFVGRIVERGNNVRAELLRLSVTDRLTGLHNHNYLRDAFEKELERAKRYKEKMAFVMLDLDNFKNINDSFGHIVGDKVLAKVAETIRRNLRQIDYVFRYGGDEFIVLLPRTGKLEALKVMERLLDRIARISIEVNGKGVKVTASSGIAIFPEHGGDLEALLQKADQAMYQAKQWHKNHVHVYELQESF